jgi:hypothetical protein
VRKLRIIDPDLQTVDVYRFNEDQENSIRPQHANESPSAALLPWLNIDLPQVFEDRVKITGDADENQ